LLERGVDGLFRMHQRRKFDFRGGRQLGWEHSEKNGVSKRGFSPHKRWR
jgi:hypothetical protein